VFRANAALRIYYEHAGYHLVRYRDFDREPSAALASFAPAETALYEKHVGR
jgi:hypothetical protein